jgi:hypothetical protein
VTFSVPTDSQQSVPVRDVALLDLGLIPYLALFTVPATDREASASLDIQPKR